MKQRYYSIRDNVAEEHGPLFTGKNDAVAQRSFDQMITSKKLAREDFSLVYVGTFNSESGMWDEAERNEVLLDIS